MFFCEYCVTFKNTYFEEHLKRCLAAKRNHLNMLLLIFMFSCANLCYKYAEIESNWVLNFKSVKITDMKSTPIWISYNFWTCKHLDKLDQKAIWQFHVGQFSCRASCKDHLTHEKMMGFDYCEKYLRSTWRKYYYGSVKKSKCSFSCHLQIDKKVNNVNKNRSNRKNWFKFCLWGFSKKESHVVHISFYTTRYWNSR